MIVESMIRLELCSVLSDLYHAREAQLKSDPKKNEFNFMKNQNFSFRLPFLIFERCTFIKYLSVEEVSDVPLR